MRLKNGRIWGKKNTSFFAMILTILDLEKNLAKKFDRIALACARPGQNGSARDAQTRGVSDGPSHLLSRARARKEGKKRREGPSFPSPPVGVPPEGDEPTGHEDESQ